jgi:hypothetical protein
MDYNTGANAVLFKEDEVREGDYIKVHTSDGSVRRLLVQPQGDDMLCNTCALSPSDCIEDATGSLLCCTGNNFMKFIAMEDLI